MLKRRVDLLKHYLSGRRNGVGIVDALANILGPTSYYKAKKYISNIVDYDNYFRAFYFKDYDKPLFVAKKLGVDFMNQMVSELFRPQEWHYYETPETTVRSNDYCLDAGAAEGLFTYLVADRCAQVYAVEPLPDFVIGLQKTFANNGNVEILSVALSDKPGELYLSPGGICTTVAEEVTNGNQKVEVKTVDQIILEKNRRLTYLKADLEGYERKMIHGAKNSLIKYRPRIAITTYHNKDDHKYLADFLQSLNLGYNIKFKGVEERYGQPVMLHAWTQES